LGITSPTRQPWIGCARREYPELTQLEVERTTSREKKKVAESEAGHSMAIV
jgi:hypothetical protein